MKFDYAAAIELELSRLDHFKGHKKRRDAMIRAFADAAARGIPQSGLFGSQFEGIRLISKRMYYGKDKSWYADPLYQEVLKAVSDLYSRRDNEEREAVEAAARRKRHEERVTLIRAGKSKLAQLIKDMEVSKQTPAQVASFLRAIFEAELAEFDELPTQRSRVLQENYEIDLDRLTDEELERVAQGESPLRVIADRLLALPTSGPSYPDAA